MHLIHSIQELRHFIFFQHFFAIQKEKGNVLKIKMLVNLVKSFPAWEYRCNDVQCLCMFVENILRLTVLKISVAHLFRRVNRLKENLFGSFLEYFFSRDFVSFLLLLFVQSHLQFNVLAQQQMPLFWNSLLLYCSC